MLLATLPCETLMSAEQALNDKFQGSVNAYLRCGGFVNNQRFTAECESEIFLISKYLTKLQAKTWLPHALRVLANTLLKGEESVRDNHVLACNFAKYLPILIFFTHRLSDKPFLIWLLTTPPHLKYAATLLCNLSLRAGFANINVSQGSVAT